MEISTEMYMKWKSLGGYLSIMWMQSHSLLWLIRCRFAFLRGLWSSRLLLSAMHSISKALFLPSNAILSQTDKSSGFSEHNPGKFVPLLLSIVRPIKFSRESEARIFYTRINVEEIGLFHSRPTVSTRRRIVSQTRNPLSLSATNRVLVYGGFRGPLQPKPSPQP